MLLSGTVLPMLSDMQLGLGPRTITLSVGLFCVFIHPSSLGWRATGRSRKFYYTVFYAPGNQFAHFALSDAMMARYVNDPGTIRS